jgi:cystathionine beta-lyase/cystathionine gamma-synthase
MKDTLAPAHVPGFSTTAIHAGNAPDPRTGAVSVPVYQTSTYAQEGLGKNKGYEYARSQNPTREALEANVAALENGVHGLAYGSGLAATTTLLHLLKAGDHVVASNNMYGGTFRLFDRVFADFGLTFSYVNTADLAAVEAAVRPATRLLFVETPTNPLLTITDLAGIAGIAQRHGALTACDNTFATPYLQRPLDFGIDVALHSTTKYLNGHSDMVGGIAVVKDDALAERMQFILNTAGAVPGAFDAWLVLRGTKTLHLRMPRHDENGRKIASWLAEKLGHENVIYPGLPSHPQHELAKRQMKGFGGMISVLTGSKDKAANVLRKVRVFSLAESLGGVESLISHPASMTHASVPPERRAALGLRDDLLRLSCGVEDIGDLIADLDQAFA